MTRKGGKDRRATGTDAACGSLKCSIALEEGSAAP